MKKIFNELVVCKDGFTFSCQANEGAYCSPRQENMPHYTEVEVGYPSRVEPLLAEYAEDQHNLRDTVYPYVPARLIYVIIAKHGGISSGQVPRGVPEFGVTHCNPQSSPDMALQSDT